MKKKLIDPMLISRRNAQMLLDAELTQDQMGCVYRALLTYQYEGILPKKHGSGQPGNLEGHSR